MCRWPLLLLWGLLPRAAAGGSGGPFPHRTLLDSEGKYWLSWGPRGGRLAFRLEVRTAGYVGFGFSPTGAMAAADIVVGGVARGRPYLQESTVRVIWAYHHEDVGEAGPKYHESNRGTKSLRLLNPEKTNVLSTAVPYFDLVNQNGFSYPPHVGLSLGTPLDPHYVLLEVHYDNPTYKEGLIDNSGLRLFYTADIRKYDAGVIEAGLWVSLFHTIPPGLPDFRSEGHCTLECLEEALEAEKPSGIHVFAVLLHAHLAGRGIRLRHFRKGEEMRLLAYDDDFDFNFQEFQYLKEEQTILPGDNLITECRYNTKDRARMTWGGLSTRNEMCLSYLLYYPRINLTRCASIPDIMEQLQFIGVKEIYRPVTTWPFIIKSPKQYKNLSFMDAMNKFKWTKKEGLAFNKLVLSLPVNVRCSKTDNAEWSIQGMTALPPDIERPYRAEPLVCGASSTSLHGNACLELLLGFVVLGGALSPRSVRP
ncbi:hypothetical protein FD754_004421 [Muntiacus muntjak]|uniref:DOMON domain-containing protein n=1 Tax=Muntiacus muntjak TaxID=9888 RepID=A0A5N3WHT0_MUNMU|nr:hypothetical protein FD754_004421 [Muntiacus muntjak]